MPQYRRIELTPVGTDPKPKQYRAVLWSDDDVEDATIDVGGEATPFVFASVAAQTHKCDVQCVVREGIDDPAELPGVSRNEDGGESVSVASIRVPLPKNGTVGEFTLSLLAQPWEPPVALLSIRYRQLHRACPNCGSAEIESTTIGYVMSELASHENGNRAWCQCGWSGIVHDLVPCVVRGRHAIRP